MNEFIIKGVVEGFYGKPWTWAQRGDIIKFISKEGYNLYIYAPKADELHRNNWREMYGEQFISDFKQLIEIGNSTGVEVSMAISPGLSLIHCDHNELVVLKEKYLQFAKLGAKTISLFLDDIPNELIHEKDKKTYASLANAQADFANRLYRELAAEIEDMRFILCPTHYHGKTMTDYHYTLGKELDENILLMWTGPQVCSQELTVENAQMVENAFARKPLYWDNFPVNDSVMVPELHIGLFTGRDPQLAKHASGFIVNPMNQPYASMIALKNIAAYLREPTGYNPEEALAKTFKQMYPDIADELLLFSKANDSSPLRPGEPEITNELLKKLKEYNSEGKINQIALFLEETGEKIYSASEKIKNTVDTKLLTDIREWLEEFAFYSELMFDLAKAFEEIEIVYKDEQPLEERIGQIHLANKKLEMTLKKLCESKTKVFGKGLREFAFETLITCKGLVRLVDWK